MFQESKTLLLIRFPVYSLAILRDPFTNSNPEGSLENLTSTATMGVLKKIFGNNDFRSLYNYKANLLRFNNKF